MRGLYPARSSPKPSAPGRTSSLSKHSMVHFAPRQQFRKSRPVRHQRHRNSHKYGRSFRSQKLRTLQIQCRQRRLKRAQRASRQEGLRINCAWIWFYSWSLGICKLQFPQRLRNTLVHQMRKLPSRVRSLALQTNQKISASAAQ